VLLVVTEQLALDRTPLTREERRQVTREITDDILGYGPLEPLLRDDSVTEVMVNNYDRVFVEQLKNLASPGDLLVAISGSGNSPNVLRAVDWANGHGLTTFGCTGFSGGKLRGMVHHGLHVPLDDMGVVESIHLTAFHWVVDDTYRRISL
jgi:hypothetical protein